jgi:tight adherence protein C
MVAIVIIGAGLMGLTVGLLVRAFAMPSAASLERIQQIESYGFTGVPEGSARRRSEPAIRDLARAIGRWLIDHSPRISEADVKRDLTRAGMYATSPALFIGYRLVSSVLVTLGFLGLTLAGGSSPALVIVGTPLAAIFGFILPRALLNRRIKERIARIDRDLPDLVDILVITIEAGIGLSRSVQVASGRLSGPLGDELRLTIQEEQMGLATGDAFANMQDRCDAPSMRSFVRSIAQGQTLGVSIGDIMRSLAVEMRTRRRQNAETLAQKAPVKILFPLVLMIFPAMFLVLLYPALHNLAQTLGS